MELAWSLIALGVAVFLLAYALVHAAHTNLLLYAEMSRDWAERGQFYDDQLAALKLAIPAVEPDKEPLVGMAFFFLRQHYTESSKSAWSWSERYAARIPQGVRAWYLRTTG